MDLVSASIVGRERELAALVDGIEDALAGRGSVWLVSGEAGIGKSRLAEEAAKHARGRGASIYWGRCWEAGGAPAYWPWVQILRELLVDGAAGELSALPRPRVALLAQLLPELRGQLPDLESAPALESEQARFQLMDAVASLLFGSARGHPQLLLLEDLHAADAASLQLLEFVAIQARSQHLCLIASFRETEAERSGVGSVLSRVGREARTLSLPRLGREAVASYLEQVRGTASDAVTVDALHAATEGNPLFLVETTRLLMARGVETLARDSGFVVPRSVANALRARLGVLSDEARALLEVGAVSGREFSRARLAQLSGGLVPELAVLLAEAVDSALLSEDAPGQYRFSHILIRETLYGDLPPERRAALHLAHADAIESGSESSIAWSELAHHLLEAGAAAAPRAAAAARRAAEHAEAQHAAEEAVRLYALALDAHDRSGQPDGAQRAELLLGQGRTRMLVGDVDGGRACCLEVAAIARATDDTGLLARAALELGAVFDYARVSRTLLDLLGEALGALDPGDSALRARLMARRAAASQPSLRPEEPIAEAREAIAMARRVGDERALLGALRMGGSALMDVTDAAERIGINAESVALAEKVRDPMTAFRGHMRLVFDCYELADLAAAHAHIARCERIAEELGHPHYRWQVLALHAMQAIREGRFEDAGRLAEQAAELGARAGESNAANALLLQRAGMLQLQGRFDELEVLMVPLQRLWSGTRSGESLAHVIVCAANARVAGARACGTPVDRTAVEDVLVLGDRTQLDNLAEVCRLAADPALAGRVIERLAPGEDRFVSGGVAGLSWDHPASRSLAILRWVRGEHEEARRLLERAREQCERTGAPAHRAWVIWDLARLELEMGRPERASPLLEQAAATAGELGMPGLLERVEGALAEQGRPAASRPASRGERGSGAPGIRMRREGEVWLLESADAALRLKDTKGVRLLARLIEEPGRELHVLDLIDSGTAVDGGDSGELLDRRARAEYEQRARDIAGEIELAREHNDSGRVEVLRAELELVAGELQRGRGLGGRARRAGSAVERARVNVQRRLRDAIRRVEACDPALGRILDRAIRTGTYCCYDPQ